MQFSPTARPVRLTLAAVTGAGLLVTGLALPGAASARPSETASTALAATPSSLAATAPTGPDLAPAAAKVTTSGSTTATTRRAQSAVSPAVTSAVAPPVSSVFPVRGVRSPGTGLFHVASVPIASWMPNSTVEAMVTDGTYAYLGGEFTQLHNATGSQTGTYTRLARINLTTGVPDPTWTPTVDGTVLSLALNSSNTTLYVGGQFATVDGQPRANLAAVSTSGAGAVTAFNPTTDDRVTTLLVDGSEVVVGGAFGHIANVHQQRLAKVVASTSALDPSFLPVLDGNPFTVAKFPGQAAYVVGGNFATVGGAARNDLAVVSSSTGAPTSWNASGACTSVGGCPVYSVAFTGTQLIAAQGGPGGRLAAYNLSSGAIQWAIAADGNDQAVAVAGNEVFVGGHFGPQFGSATRQTLALVDARTGAIDPTFAPTTTKNFPGTWALLITPQGLIVGGAQPKISGTAQSCFAIFPRIDATPAAPPGTHLGTAGAHP